MPALADLFVAGPVVTVMLAVKPSRISQQAATTMIDVLASSVLENAGREGLSALGSTADVQESLNIRSFRSGTLTPTSEFGADTEILFFG